ncbi:type VII secretion protein EccB [Streptomyces sp. 8N616]|uniref:type VII secretion protein EccB n=1 Tax=Streptomyces sp. 8N616 TaxID=3457414 RepID=UPI003FD16807
MRNNKDQLQAHAFLVGRTSSALLLAEPDAPETPMRRFTVGTFVGVMISVILIAGFAVYGLVRPGGKSGYDQPNTIAVEKESGARYVFLDGALHPVLNTASARLLTGGEGEVRSFSRNSLGEEPVGLPVGIPGAPDRLPDPGHLASGPWSVCATTDTDSSGRSGPSVTLTVGGDEPDSSAEGSPGGREEAVLVRGRGGTTYLVWRGSRLKVTGHVSLDDLADGSAAPFTVDETFVNALTAGPDLEAPDIPGRGQRGPQVGGQPARVGQVFAVTTVGQAKPQYHVLLEDGLTRVSATVAFLVLGDPASREAYPDGRAAALPLSAADKNAAPRSAAGLDVPSGYPDELPKVVSAAGGRAPCVRYEVGAHSTAELVVLDKAPEARTPVRGAGGDRGRAVADKVGMPPGGGLLARALPAPGADHGTLFVVTDLGVKYPVPDREVADALGLGGVQPVHVPSTVLAFLPTGPALDPAEAGRVHPLSRDIGGTGVPGR